MSEQHSTPVTPTDLSEFRTFQDVGSDPRIPFSYGQLVWATRGDDAEMRACVVKFSGKRYVHVPSLLHVLSTRVLAATG